MKKLWLLFLSILTLDVFAASCPTGYISYNRSLQFQLATSCPSGTTDVGAVPASCSASPTTCMPDYVCESGVSELKTGTGVSVSLYSQKVVAPSLHVSVGGKVCYTPLVSGSASGSINIKYNNTNYHASPLKICRKNLDAANVPSASAPGDNSVNWSVAVGDRTLKGISYCASQGTLSASALNVTSKSITNTSANSDLSANLRCWCRVYSPFPSDWIYVNWFSTYGATGCNKSCAQACVNAFAQTGTATRANTYKTMY